MDCLNKKCSITDVNERMLSCWLCHGLTHFKCSGIPTLAAEASQKHDGLFYCCVHCRKLGIDFYKFFQSRKSIFLQLQKSVVDLNNRVEDYGKLFDSYTSLDNYKSPPQSSPKRRKSSRAVDKVINVDGPATSSSVLTINNAEFSTPLTSATPNAIQGSVSNKTKKVKSKTVTIQPATNLNDDNNNNKTVHQELRFLPPRKSIFLSRCVSETTVEDIKNYIQSKLNYDADISIHKFSYSQPRSITSFKITPSPDIYDQIVDPSFWPMYTLVKEYIFKENRRTNNAVRFSSVSSVASPNQKN